MLKVFLFLCLLLSSVMADTDSFDANNTEIVDENTIDANTINVRNFNHLFGIKLSFDVLSIIFGLIVIIGGLTGYLKSGSVMSLVSGLVFGILIFTGSYFSSRDSTNVYLLLGTFS